MSRYFLAAIAAVALSATSVTAAPYSFISAPSGLVGPSTLDDFEGLAIGTTLPLTTGIATITTGQDWPNEPTQISEFTNAQTPGVWEGNAFWSRRDAKFYAFSFSQGISEFGFGVYGMQFSGNTLQLFDENNQSLQSFTVGPASSNGTVAQYIGFTGTEANVYSVLLDFGGPDAVGIDNLSFTTGDVQPVPVPAGLPLLLVGLGGFAALRARRG